MNDTYLDRACEVITDRMVIVNIAAKRSRELARGSASMVSTPHGQSHLDTALLEIAEGKLIVDPATIIDAPTTKVD